MRKILRLNGHLKKIKTNDDGKSDLDKIKLLKAKEHVYMSFHECIIFCFLFQLCDIPFTPFGIVTGILAPWRIPHILYIFMAPEERIPIKFKFSKLWSDKRAKLLSILLTYLVYDYLALLTISFLFITIWRSIETYVIIKKYLTYDMLPVFPEKLFILLEKN